MYIYIYTYTHKHTHIYINICKSREPGSSGCINCEISSSKYNILPVVDLYTGIVSLRIPGEPTFSGCKLHKLQKHIHNPDKHLRWIFLRK